MGFKDEPGKQVKVKGKTARDNKLKFYQYKCMS